jgi:hypothetical protein
MGLNLRPAVCGQNQYCQQASGEILLVAQIAIGGNERIEALSAAASKAPLSSSAQPIS